MRKTDLHIGQEVCYQGQCAIVIAIGGWEFAISAGYVQSNYGDQIALAHNLFEDYWVPTLAKTKDIKCTWQEWQKERHWKSVRSANIDRILAKAKQFGLPFIRNALEELNDNMLDNFENLLHEGAQFRIIQENLPLLPRGRSIAFYPECNAPYVMQTPNGDAHLSAPSFVELVQQFPGLFKK